MRSPPDCGHRVCGWFADGRCHLEEPEPDLVHQVFALNVPYEEVESTMLDMLNDESRAPSDRAELAAALEAGRRARAKRNRRDGT
jgi:hypothetical protein